MARLRLFGPARDAAGGRREDVVRGEDVAAVLAEATRRYGSGFAAVLERSAIWLNGDPIAADAPVGDDDELAVIPPVSGG